MAEVRERYRRALEDPEEAADCLEAALRGGDPEDPDASWVGARLLAQVILSWTPAKR